MHRIQAQERERAYDLCLFDCAHKDREHLSALRLTARIMPFCLSLGLCQCENASEVCTEEPPNLIDGREGKTKSGDLQTDLGLALMINCCFILQDNFFNLKLIN